MALSNTQTITNTVTVIYEYIKDPLFPPVQVTIESSATNLVDTSTPILIDPPTTNPVDPPTTNPVAPPTN